MTRHYRGCRPCGNVNAVCPVTTRGLPLLRQRKRNPVLLDPGVHPVASPPAIGHHHASRIRENQGVNLRGTLLATATLISVACPATAEAPGGNPWRLQAATALPPWLKLQGSWRLRGETLDGQFRAGREGGDQVLLHRLQIRGDLDLGNAGLVIELQDSRIGLDDEGTPTSPNLANPTDVLQAHLSFKSANTMVRAGRMTIDAGSRRLFARNRFRNTVNAFDGVDLTWARGIYSVRGQALAPVVRRVNGDPGDNRPRLDRSYSNIQLTGLHLTRDAGVTLQLGMFYLSESDSRNLQTRNRNLATTSLRILLPPRAGRWDFELDTAFQHGHSRTSVAATTHLRHSAYLVHVGLGRSSMHGIVRAEFQYDYASGDKRGSDGENNRFDSLFGGRRFDFGPTSIFGPFARANLRTPGVRALIKGPGSLTTMLALRRFSVASKQDTWVAARLGGSKSYLASQFETRFRWDLVPGQVRIESGFAFMHAGDLARQAGKKDALFGYGGFTVTF